MCFIPISMHTKPWTPSCSQQVVQPWSWKQSDRKKNVAFLSQRQLGWGKTLNGKLDPHLQVRDTEKCTPFSVILITGPFLLTVWQLPSQNFYPEDDHWENVSNGVNEKWNFLSSQTIYIPAVLHFPGIRVHPTHRPSLARQKQRTRCICVPLKHSKQTEVTLEKVLCCAWIKILLMHSVCSQHGLMSWAGSCETSLVVANVNKRLAGSL